MFYTSLQYMKNRYDKVTRQNGLKATSLEEYEVWKDKTRKHLWEMLGLDKMEKGTSAPQILFEDEYEGCFRQKILIETLPEVFMPLYILTPKNVTDKTKVFITPSGHLGGGVASIIGDRSNPLVDAKIDNFNYDYGLQLAKRGCIVVAPETIGFGERRELANQKEEDILSCSCYHISHMATPLGMTLAGIQTFDLICLVDYLVSREDIDISNLTCLGFSGGGMQTLWLSAFDERIKNAVISGYMYGYKDALLERNGNCNCNYIPNLWENYDMGDIGALIAPRRLFVQTGDKDHLNGKGGVENVKTQIEIIKKAYALYGAVDMVDHDVFEGPHRWYSDKIDKYI